MGLLFEPPKNSPKRNVERENPQVKFRLVNSLDYE